MQNFKTPSNVIFSPLGSLYALAYLHTQTAAETQMQISDYTFCLFPMHEVYDKLQQWAPQIIPTQSLCWWISPNFVFFAQPPDSTKKYFSTTKIQWSTVDFIHKDPKKVVEEIGHWAGEKTSGVIKSLTVAPNKKTTSIVTQVLYFQFDFKLPFPKSLTAPAAFDVLIGPKSKTKKITVPMMHLSNVEAAYGSHVWGSGKTLVQFESVTLASSNDEFNFIFLKPKTPSYDALKELGTTLFDIKLTKPLLWILNGESKTELFANIVIPKFRLDTRNSFHEGLNKAGIKNIFTKNANFYPITRTPGLGIDEFVQHITLEVSDTDKAANPGEAMMIAYEFTLDHSFICIIAHAPSKTIVFAGQILEPMWK